MSKQQPRATTIEPGTTDRTIQQKVEAVEEIPLREAFDEFVKLIPSESETAAFIRYGKLTERMDAVRVAAEALRARVLR